MLNHVGNDKLFERYLLGDLSEEEKTRLEESYFADDNLFEQLLAAEDDLIDDYVQGQLIGHERALFEKRFLNSPERRQRVALARGLMKTVAPKEVVEEIATVKPESSPWWKSFLVPLLPQSAFGQFSMVAAVLLVIIGGIVLFTLYQQTLTTVEPSPVIATVDPTPQPTPRTNEQASPPVEVRPEEDRAPQPPVLAQRDRPRRETRPQERRPNRRQDRLIEDVERRRPQIGIPEETTAANDRENLEVASLQISPYVSRGGESPRLVIPPGANTVQLQLGLRADIYQSYRAILRTDSGAEVWRSSALQSRAAPSGNIVIARFPRRLLTGNAYVMTVNGTTSEGRQETVGNYSFQVEQR
jgi:hypothetical protein